MSTWRAHKSRFHKQNDGSIDEFEDKSVEAREDDSSSRLQSDMEKPHPAFGYDVYKYAREGERKRFRSDDEISNESNRSDFKKAKHIILKTAKNQWSRMSILKWLINWTYV